jgi:hypothetical protein
MALLDRATELLLPLMSEDRRDTWLSLAFHDHHRGLYDAIPQHGATADFTVRCVRQLLDRGCLGGRHALSLLLEVVRSDAGDEQQQAFQALIDALDRRCTGSDPPDPPDPRPANPLPTQKGARPPPSPHAAPPAEKDVSTMDFFVSYNQADRDWAEWIAWQLEDAGYTTRIQAWDFHAGSNFVVDMDRAARQSRQTIAVLSPDYLAARFPTAEWAAAFARDPTGNDRALLLGAHQK